MDALLNDIRIAVRRLYMSRVFALMAIGTLAIGLGANTAVFTLINAIRLRPLPFAAPGQLVDVYEHHPQEVCAGCGVGTSYLNFQDWKRAARSFSAMAAYDEGSAAVRLNENAKKLYVAHVSADLFPLLGVNPLRGRFFTREEEQSGAGSVALVSEGLAERTFGDAVAAVGKSVRVDGARYTIVGVMPERFMFPEHSDVWVPFQYNGTAVRNDRSIGVVARLADGVGTDQAAAEMRVIGQGLATQFPAEQKGWNAYVMSLHGDLASDYVQQGTLLLGAVSCVLLIVCANLANLMLARTSGRRAELAVRAALGASRWQLARQMLVESMVISFAGGLLGLILAMWGVELLRTIGASALPRWIRYDMDWRVFAYVFFISALTGMLFGLLPARLAGKASVADVLKDGGRGTAGARGSLRVRDLLVVVQLAVAFVLVATAGLLTKGMLRTSAIDVGYDLTGLMRADIGLTSAKYDVGLNTATFTAQMLEAVQRGRGVKSVAMSGSHFLNWPGTPQQVISIDDVSAERSATALHRVQGVTSAYFETLGLAQVAGRFFTSSDGSTAPHVAVVNQTLARNLWNDKPAVGKQIRIGTVNWTVVGVVSDMRESPVGNGTTPLLYVPLAQLPTRQPTGQPLTLSIRTVAGAPSIPAVVNAAALQIDPDVTIENVGSVESFLREWRKPMQTTALFAGVIAVFASLLAALGVYGVLAYIVSQRTHEIGIRMALGASVGDVLRLIMRHGLKLSVAGTAIGIAVSGAFTQLLGYMLYGVSPVDPVVYAVAAIAFTGVAMLAVYLPSRQASRVQPMEALRTE